MKHLTMRSRAAFLSCLFGSVAATTVSAAPQGVVTVAVAQIEASGDPAKFNATLTYPLMKIAYDGLIGLAQDGSLAPQLATAWESPDQGKSWVFTLRENVTFSNGDTFDAEDAKATLAHYAAPGSLLANFLDNVAEVTVEAPNKLKITQKEADVTLPVILADRPGVMLSQEVLAQSEYPLMPIGTGPYILKEEVPGVSLHYVANPDHWNADAVKAAEVIVRRIEDPVSRANGLRSGEIDMAIVSASMRDDISRTSHLEMYQISGRSRLGLTLNPELYAPLKDERVRRALSLAIDREGQAYGALFGEAEPASQFAPKSDRYYSDALEPLPFDLEKAKALLVEAGHGDGLAFTVTVIPRYRTLAEAMQADWARIGVKIDLVFPTGTGNSQRLWFKPDVPVGYWAIDGRNDLGYFYKLLFATDGPYNPAHFADEPLVALIREANKEVDEAKRKDLIAQISKRSSEFVGVQIPMVHEYQIVAYSKKLQGVSGWQGGFPYVHGVSKPD